MNAFADYIVERITEARDLRNENERLRRALEQAIGDLLESEGKARTGPGAALALEDYLGAVARNEPSPPEPRDQS